MIQIKSKLRRWGNSFGIVVPQKVVEKEDAKEGEEVIVLFTKRKNTVLREMFGSHKFKKSTEQLMREADEELYDD